MSELQIFSAKEFGKIRVVERNGEPWFIGKDVAEALGYINTQKAVLMHVKQNHKADVPIWDGSQNRNQIIIDEAGLYSLVMRAKTEKAEAFQEWVTSEVLPAIRKHGGYLTANKIEEVLTDPDTNSHKRRKSSKDAGGAETGRSKAQGVICRCSECF